MKRSRKKICYTRCMDKIDEILTRGVANVIPNKNQLEKVISSGKKLNVYLGIDPTATQIHLGHAVALRKLQALADLGHNVTFLIGDFTALVGDTSDKDSERPKLTNDQIQKNFRTYKDQAEKLLDFSKVTVVYNSRWLKNLTFADVQKLVQEFSLNDFIGRELIKKRLDEGKNVGLLETLYPLMQGYDSYFLDTDIQIGGTDQTFNMQAGRILQKRWRQKESFVLATEFLMGTDGRKMSKTWGNAIWLNDVPNDMYAKAMSIRDDLIMQYLTLATKLSLADIQELKTSIKNPMTFKKKLAYEIVKELHDEKKAMQSQEAFESVVQKRQLPEDILIFKYTGQGNETLADFLLSAGLALSKSESKRLIEQGGVNVDNKVIIDPNAAFTPKQGTIVKVGKRKIVKIKTE